MTKTSTHHCAEENCEKYIHRESSRFWCEQHEIDRRKRIDEMMDSIGMALYGE
jgi:hypothetical protein